MAPAVRAVQGSTNGTNGLRLTLGMPGVLSVRSTYATNNAGGGTTISMSWSAVVGDVIVGSVTVVGGTGCTITTPVNSASEAWTLLKRDNSGTALAQAMFWKVATATDVAAGTIAVSITSAKASSTTVVVAGASTTAPTSTYYRGQANASSLTVTMPASGTITAQNGIDICMTGMARGANTVGTNANYVHGAESSSTGGGAGSRTQSHCSTRILTPSGTSIASFTEVWTGTGAVNIGQAVFIAQAPTAQVGDTLLLGVTSRGGSANVTLGVNPFVTGNVPGVAVNYPDGWGRPVTNGTGTWLLVSSNRLAVSTDNGKTWTLYTASWSSSSMVRAAYGNGKWVIVTGAGPGVVWTATNPAGTWTENTQTEPWTGGYIYGLAYSPTLDLWCVTGYNIIATATNPGGTWTMRDTTTITGSGGGVTWGNGYFVACWSYNLSPYYPQWSYSSNGTSWSSAANLPGLYFNVNGIDYGNGKWVISCQSNGRSYISSSTPPTSFSTQQIWHTSSSIAPANVVYGNGLWVAGGSYQGAIAVSTDDTATWTWYAGLGENYGGGAVGYGNGVWVASGNIGSSNSFVSTWDGTSQRWTLLNRTDTTDLSQAVWWRVADGTEPSSVWVSLHSYTSYAASGAIVAISGTDASGPSEQQQAQQSNASSVTVTAPTLGTWMSATGVDLGFFGTAYGTSFTPPTNYTERADSATTGTTTAVTTELASRDLSGVTTVGSIAATAANAAVNIGHHYFIPEFGSGTRYKTLTLNANIKGTVYRSFSIDAVIEGFNWVEPPASGAQISPSTALSFYAPIRLVGPIKFQIQLDTVNTFNTANLVTYGLGDGTWEYYNGSTWVAMPSTGLPQIHVGTKCRFTPPSLANGTWYRRVRYSVL